VTFVECRVFSGATPRNGAICWGFHAKALHTRRSVQGMNKFRGWTCTKEWHVTDSCCCRQSLEDHSLQLLQCL